MAITSLRGTFCAGIIPFPNMRQMDTGPQTKLPFGMIRAMSGMKLKRILVGNCMLTIRSRMMKHRFMSKTRCELSLREATAGGRPYQIVTARWKLFEKNGVNYVHASMNDPSLATYSRILTGDYGFYNPATSEARVELVIPDYFPSGTYELNRIAMQDIALNDSGVYFTHTGDELPATIEVQTANPDTIPPELDVNRITIEAEPTNPAAPNGETRVDITFRVKDNISGYKDTAMLLRDPQDVEHYFVHQDPDAYQIYFSRDPTVYETYKKTIILPVGSVPGIWGLAEMTVWDKAQNKLLADFTEIVRFEVETASAKPVALADGPQLQQNAPNPFNSQTIHSVFLARIGCRTSRSVCVDWTAGGGLERWGRSRQATIASTGMVATVKGVRWPAASICIDW